VRSAGIHPSFFGHTYKLLLFCDRVPEYEFGDETECQGRYRSKNTGNSDVSANRIQWKTSRTRIRSKTLQTKSNLYVAYPKILGNNCWSAIFADSITAPRPLLGGSEGAKLSQLVACFLGFQHPKNGRMRTEKNQKRAELSNFYISCGHEIH